jgi:hypothetical protein
LVYLGLSPLRDASNVAREAYRASVRATFDGEMSPVPATDLLQLLAAMESKVAHGIAKALTTNDGYSPTYFSYECTEYVHDESTGDLTALAFKQHYLPLFLEGPTRHMKVPRLVCLALLIYVTVLLSYYPTCCLFIPLTY